MLLPGFAGRIRPLDRHADRALGSFRVPEHAPLDNALIAAIAVANNMPVVTRNTKHLESLGGVRLIQLSTYRSDGLLTCGRGYVALLSRAVSRTSRRPAGSQKRSMQHLFPESVDSGTMRLIFRARPRPSATRESTAHQSKN